MGQKANPKSLRLAFRKNWTSTFSEKKKSEAGKYLSITQNVKNFLQQFFNNKGFIVEHCSISLCEGRCAVHVVLHATPSSWGGRRRGVKEGFERFSVVARNRESLQKASFLLSPESSTGKLEKLLSTFLGIYNIKIFITSINQSYTHNFYGKDDAKKALVGLKRFKKSSFFFEGLAAVFFTARCKNFAQTLLNFVVSQIKGTKKTKQTLAFLKQSIDLLVLQKRAVVTGVKMQISGRINGAKKARHENINAGVVPRNTFSTPLKYAEGVVHSTDGSCGIKVWVAYTERVRG